MLGFSPGKKSQDQHRTEPKLELSFEYLLSKDRLQWITVNSPQVIFISLCLQSMVEELMRKQHGSNSSTGSFQQVNPVSALRRHAENHFCGTLDGLGSLAVGS
jgi:hypothetical protein